MQSPVAHEDTANSVSCAAVPLNLCMIVSFSQVSLLMGDAVPTRSAKEIAGMRVACRLAREILDKAHAAVKPGVTTDEIDQVVSQLNTTASALWQVSFKTLKCQVSAA